MNIKEIVNNKNSFLDILLIGDENELMIQKYLYSGKLFALYEKNNLISICVVIQKNSKTIEIKNLATYPEHQNKGYATILLEFICNKFKKDYNKIILGTGENEITLNFYKKRGFKELKRIKNFFKDNYPTPIIENGKQLIDMIYLVKNL